MLLLSLSGSYIATFGQFDDSSKSILMSCLNLSTAILSGVYTFFSFTKKGQTYKESASVLFYKIEKLKCIISTLLSDKEYEDMKSIQYYIKCESYKYVYSKLEIEKKLNIIIPVNRDKKIISQSIYAFISKEIINKIRLFVLINL
jgi:hypothetical protein